MALGDFISAAVSANGVVLTTIHEDGAGLLGTLDATKLATVNLTSEGYSGGSLGTVARSIAAIPVSKAASGGNTEITWHLRHKSGNENDGAQVHDDDTAVTVTYAAGVLHTAYTTAAVTNGAVTNNSDLDYPKVILKTAFVPRRKFTGTLNVDFIAFAMYGIDESAVSLTDDAAGSATQVIGGGDFTLVARSGSLGPAAFVPLYRATFSVDTGNGGSPFSLGLGVIDIVCYPRVGDADSVYDTSTATDRPTSLAIDTAIYEPDCEVYLDPANAEAAADAATAYVDGTLDVATGAVTGGPYQDREIAIGVTSQTPVTIIGSPNASPIRFNYCTEGKRAAMSVAIDTLVGGPPQPNESFEEETGGIVKNGRVIDYGVAGAGVLRYLNVNNTGDFADNDAITFHQSGATANINGTPSSIGSTIASGEVVRGTKSGATATTSGVPAGNWSGTPAVGDINNPYQHTVNAIQGIRAADGRSPTRADGGTVYLKQGDHLGDTSTNGAGLAPRTDYYPVNITRAPGLAIGDARIVDYDEPNGIGLMTNCVRIHNVTLFAAYYQAFIRSSGLGGSLSTNRAQVIPSLHLDSCIIESDCDQSYASLVSGFNGIYATNCEWRNIGNAVTPDVMMDCYIHDMSGDVFSGGTPCIINLDLDTIEQKGSAHTDIHQLSSAASNIVLYCVRGVELLVGQQGPFYPTNDSVEVSNVAWVNVLQESMSNSAFLGPGAYANFLFWDCVFASTFQFQIPGGFTQASFDNFSFRRCFLSQVAKDQTGGAFTLFPAMLDSCHIRTTNAEPAGTNQGTGGTLADLFDVINDPDDPAHYSAQAAGALDSVSGEIPFPYDLYGAEWPVDGSAAIGAISTAEGGGGGVAVKYSALVQIGTL